VIFDEVGSGARDPRQVLLPWCAGLICPQLGECFEAKICSFCDLPSIANSAKMAGPSVAPFLSRARRDGAVEASLDARGTDPRLHVSGPLSPPLSCQGSAGPTPASNTPP